MFPPGLPKSLTGKLPGLGRFAPLATGKSPLQSGGGAAVVADEELPEDVERALEAGHAFFEPAHAVLDISEAGMRVPRFRGRFIGAVYVALRFNTPSVGGEQDFPAT